MTLYSHVARICLIGDGSRGPYIVMLLGSTSLEMGPEGPIYSHVARICLIGDGSRGPYANVVMLLGSTSLEMGLEGPV